MIITDLDFKRNVEKGLEDFYQRSFKVLELYTVKSKFNGGTRNVKVVLYDVENDIVVQRWLRPLLFDKRRVNAVGGTFSQTKDDKKMERKFKNIVKEFKSEQKDNSNSDFKDQSLGQLLANKNSKITFVSKNINENLEEVLENKDALNEDTLKEILTELKEISKKFDQILSIF